MTRIYLLLYCLRFPKSSSLTHTVYELGYQTTFSYEFMLALVFTILDLNILLCDRLCEGQNLQNGDCQKDMGRT